MMRAWISVNRVALALGLGGCIPGGGGNGGRDDADSALDVDRGIGGEGGTGGQGGQGGEGGAGGCMPEGATEQRPCGLDGAGVEARRCVDGAWSDWDACQGGAVCAEGQDETEPCGELGNGTRTRACAGGQWAAWGPCDDPDRICEDGAVEQAPCGLNGRGTQSHTCDGGRWGPFSDCVDPDACADGTEERMACGINGRGTALRVCAEGQLGPSMCADPDVCLDDAREERACGLNGRGTGSRRCVQGGWGDWGPCADVDVCADDTVEPRACGPNGHGREERRCVDGRYGAWGPCEGAGICADGDEQSQGCGVNGRGEETRACVVGQWSLFGVCDDPDACGDGAAEPRGGCGVNGRGQETRTCVAGQWGPFGQCDDPDVCLDGALDTEPCAGGVRTRRCARGQFEPFGQCAVEGIRIAQPGGVIELDGELTADDPTWSRPGSICQANNRPGSRLETFTIVNTTGADRTVTLRAHWREGDGFLFVFDGPVDPAAPTEGCIIGNDDFEGDVNESALEGIPIASGRALEVVASTFGVGDDLGPYTIEVFTDVVGATPLPGELIITEIMFDPAAVADRKGEWFEVQNVGPFERQLGGIRVGDDDGGRSDIEGDVTLGPGERAVIALSADPAVNGGIDVDATFSGLLLDNAGDILLLFNRDGAELDRVAYDPFAGWPRLAGRSIQLDRAISDPDENDAPANWCLSDVALPSGDFGTPGAANSACD